MLVTWATLTTMRGWDCIYPVLVLTPALSILVHSYLIATQTNCTIFTGREFLYGIRNALCLTLQHSLLIITVALDLQCYFITDCIVINNYCNLINVRPN